jgi:hypothetical protein
MDDALFGRRDRRGDWKRNKLDEYPTVFVRPARPVAFVKWVFGYPGYILPWNLFFATLSILLWLYATRHGDYAAFCAGCPQKRAHTPLAGCLKAQPVARPWSSARPRRRPQRFEPIEWADSRRKGRAASGP